MSHAHIDKSSRLGRGVATSLSVLGTRWLARRLALLAPFNSITHGYQQLGSMNHDSSLINDVCVKSSIQYRMLTGILGVIIDTRKKPRMKMPVPAK
jgi:hypothetical protein